MKRRLLLFLAALLPIMASAYDAEIDGIYYNFSGNNAEVTYKNTNYNSYSGAVSIPPSVTYNGKTYNVTNIGDWGFNECNGLTSVTIPNSVTTIGTGAFSGCSGLTSITIPNSVTSISSDAFSGCSGLNSIRVKSGNTVYDSHNDCNAIIKTATNTLIAGCKNTVIPHGVTSIGNLAFELCSGLTSITIPESVTSIGEGAFWGCNSLTSVTIGNGLAFIDTYAIPESATILTSVGKSLLTLWKEGYTNIKETETGRDLAAPEVELVNATASSLSLSYKNKYPKFNDTLIVSGSPAVKGVKGYNVATTGLEPDNLYDEFATLTLSYDDASYTKSFSFRTEPLTLATQQPRVISVGNVIVAANSNLDDEETNVGFEWRRTDWEDDFASNSGLAYLYNGTMEGYIRNLYAEKLWRYRPFYEADSGNRFYGDWVGIDPTNTSYFEPTVHTYAQITVTGNKAEVKGYAMRGTDNVTSQGFMYWPTTVASPRRKVNGVPNGAITVLASGNVMTATLEDLEYETEYCYAAFVTTSEGETFLGETQTFRTSYDPDGIKLIDNGQLTMDNEEAWYSLDGKKLGKPQKGINIIRYSDGTSKKVLIK